VLAFRVQASLLYFNVDHVLQADKGADLDFLVGKSGSFVPRDNH